MLFVLPVLPLAGCTAQETPLRAGHYGVAYQMAPDDYDHEQAEAALDACRELPGVTDTGMASSLPPLPQFEFRGTARRQRAFESCLLGLPQAAVYGPRAPGQARSPVLR